MKDLVFSITFKNHTFNIRTTPQSTLCSYESKDKYTTSLIFASNTYAFVEYKNVCLIGTVTKRDNWRININYRTVVNKRYHNCYFQSEKSLQTKTERISICDGTVEYPDNILLLYNYLIEFLQETYLCIEDKENVKAQLLEILLDLYSDDEIEDLDSIVEYENWDGVGPDEEPIIEKRRLKDILIADCQDFFFCFRQAEIDNKNKKTVLTLENVINVDTSLVQFPYELLQKEFCLFLSKNYTDLIKPTIWYVQKEVLLDIAEELSKSCQYTLFIDTVEKKIDDLLSVMVVNDIDKSELYSYFKLHYDKDYLPSDAEFELAVRKYINEQMTFNQSYKKFVSLFNSNHIKIEWDDNKLCLFQKYDKGEQLVDPQNLAEYEAYKHVIPFYRKHFLRKNSNQYRPIIRQLPSFSLYGTAVLDILFKHNVIINNGDTIVYNNNGNFEMARKEIYVLESNF